MYYQNKHAKSFTISFFLQVIQTLVMSTMEDVVMVATQGLMGRLSVLVMTTVDWSLVTVVECVYPLTIPVHLTNLCVWMENVWVSDGFVMLLMIAMTTLMRILTSVVRLRQLVAMTTVMKVLIFINGSMTTSLRKISIMKLIWALQIWF